MADSYRMERIQRLLDELRYEVNRAMLDREVEDESMVLRWVVGRSATFPNRGGDVICEFRTRPVPDVFAYIGPDDMAPKLRVIPGGKRG